jgi:Domain of unknown function (DUF1902)
MAIAWPHPILYFLIMNKAVRVFTVTAFWDEEAQVFYSETDVPGLTVEAVTFDEFIALVEALAPEMIADNLPQTPVPYRVDVQTRRNLTLAA